VPRPFVPEDLEAIEQKMRELAQADFVFDVRCGPARRRRRSSAQRGEPLKVQLIDEKTEGQSEVSVYTIKDRDTFVDFCVGPHVPSSGRLKGFKLLTTSNAYWKGDARNQPMQRVYGTAFFSEKELQEYLRRLEEAKARDHRKIGKDQKLFMFHAWAPGATFWLPKGTILYNTLSDYMRKMLVPAGLHRGQGADRLQQGAVGDLRALAALSPEHVPGRPRRRADGPEGDELPRGTC
jgi:threonyl-tRNA synthetase